MFLACFGCFGMFFVNNILGHYVTFWDVLEHFRDILGQLGKFWGILGCFGTYWGCFGTFWDVLGEIFLLFRDVLEWFGYFGKFLDVL